MTQNGTKFAIGNIYYMSIGISITRFDNQIFGEAG